ncbi:MAG: helix-turn-helix transcriptional regulator [Clostridia bacterium]|nr:helix-turn-helix transcriptional regulator [Clostridia bacterium]
MDQVKIGRFIAECRKKADLTQMQLAEKLNITDRAVSKWETGRAMPDSSIMLALCDILGISVTDLLCGEVVSMENNNKELETKLLESLREKEKADRRLLRMEIVTGILCLPVLLGCVLLAELLALPEWQKVLIVLGGLLPLLIATPFMIRIEQVAGYYECAHCKARHVPKYSSVFGAMHFGRTRYMKCPSCGKRSWQKKFTTKE